MTDRTLYRSTVTPEQHAAATAILAPTSMYYDLPDLGRPETWAERCQRAYAAAQDHAAPTADYLPWEPPSDAYYVTGGVWATTVQTPEGTYRITVLWTDAGCDHPDTPRKHATL